MGTQNAIWLEVQYPIPPATPTSISAAEAPAVGPFRQYSKAIKKADIKVDPKLGANDYLSLAEDMQLL